MFVVDMLRDLYMEMRREMWNLSSLCLLGLLLFYEWGFFLHFILMFFWFFCFILFLMHVMFLWESQDTQWMWRGAWHCSYPRAAWSRMGVLSLLWQQYDRMCNRSIFFHFLIWFFVFSVELYGIYIALIFPYTNSAVGLCCHFCEDLSLLL